MAVRSRGVKREYADEMNQQGVATQQEMDDAFSEHIANDHTAEGLLPAPSEDNQILKSYTNDDDELAWKIVKADDPQEGLTVIALPYYWDEVREKYLGNEVIRLINYLPSTGNEDEYMYYIPDTRSCVVGFNTFEGEKYCIVGLEYAADNEKSGNILEIRNITGESDSGWGGVEYEYDTLYTLDLGDDEVTKARVNDMDVLVDEGFRLCSYLLEDVDVDRPALIMMLRKVWEEE
jgi:hypothetical protein